MRYLWWLLLFGCDGFQVDHSPQLAMSLSLGPSKSCALMSDDSVKCWGNRATDLITAEGDRVPFDVLPHTIAGVDNVLELATGIARDCVLRSDRTVVCWGEEQAPAVWSSFTGSVTLASGYPQLCAVGDDRELRCATPFGPAGQVEGAAPAADARMSTANSCVRRVDGSVGCTGLNDRGQLGDGTKADSLVFTKVMLPEAALEIGLGDGFGCALSETGQVYCWGANDRGQLGDGTRISRAMPKVVRGLNWTNHLAVGKAHACALYADGRVFCWGANERGQLGLGTANDQLEAWSAVVGLDNPVQIAASWLGDHTCVISRRGVVSCWGANDRGQLGDGTLDDRLQPVQTRF